MILAEALRTGVPLTCPHDKANRGQFNVPPRSLIVVWDVLCNEHNEVCVDTVV